MIRGPRRLLLALLALCAPILLSACVIQSETDLVAADPHVTPLPQTFTMFPYNKGEGGYRRAEDQPTTFTLGRDQRYVSADGKMALGFLPLATDTYVLTATADDTGTIYGTMIVRGDFVEWHIVFSAGAEVAIKTITASAPPAIAADLAYSSSQLAITTRPTLDYLIARIVTGELPTEPLLAYIGPADANPPDAVEITDGKVIARPD